MSGLFPLDRVFPAGFSYINDFINEAEENALCDIAAKAPLKNLIFQGFEAKRKVASFGADYHFDTRKLTPGTPIPAEFDFLIEKVTRYLSISKSAIGELLVTAYPPGSIINWHRDGPPFELIAGISLLSDCVFRLRPHDKSKQGRSSILSFPVERRSLYIMQGEAREDWQHSIAPVKQLRYSITLRTLRKK